MHEYSIVTALIEQCEQLAAKNNATAITRVEIKLGILSGVEPGLLSTAFDTFKLEGICRNSELIMQIQPLLVACNDCNKQTLHNERCVICSHCHSSNTNVLDGEDMMLMQLELEQE
ncbi:hydrogenase maturation nickel metallochaperone HypA [Shewanella marinintestina]|uniref:hydrogenase maturation nickel metallochaperone HypA/HybF n=1 Tax=Shewanella marinintestina TaxID=190305 RepID=UPI00200C5B47|nr:hydrogenase maturation nickel metallochaperone HypA [Shewanella marinintestina]